MSTGDAAAGGSGVGPGAGSAADEAAKLLATVREWVDGHLATSGADCQVCPVCQGIAALRESKPQVVAHLAAAGVSLAAAVREFVDAGGNGPGGPGRPDDVEHIDIA